MASPTRPDDGAAAPRRTVLADVARAAGVSLSTASLALSGSTRSAAATRELVRRTADELGYVPHAAGRALRSRRVGAIAVAVPRRSRSVFGLPFYAALMEGVADAANSHDLMTVISTAGPDDASGGPYDRLVRGRGVDGVIVAATTMPDPDLVRLVDSGLPVVLIGRAPPDLDIPSVGSDDAAGAALVVDHLASVHGARRIAHVAGSRGRQSVEAKREGYLRGLDAAGLPADPRLFFQGDYTKESGAAAAQALRAELDRCDAVFFDSDHMAAGGVRAWQKNGVQVPADLLVAGFDDQLDEHFDEPSLTTVHVDRAVLGAAALELLVHRIDHPEAPRHHRSLPTALVVRASCGCTPAADHRP